MKSIVNAKWFGRGVQDAGKPWSQEYDGLHPNDQEAYERGRMFGTIYPAFDTVKIGRRVCPQALYGYAAARKSGLIL